MLLSDVATGLWLTCFNGDEDIRRMLDNCDIGKAMAQVIINLNLAQVETENKAAALEGGRSPTLGICRARPLDVLKVANALFSLRLNNCQIFSELFH